MKKALTIALTIIIILSLLTACGIGIAPGGGKNNAANPPASQGGDNNPAPANASASKRAVETPDKPLDLSDDGIYFIMVNGVKYNLIGATVGDFLDAGFALDNKYDIADNKRKDINEEVEAGLSSKRRSMYVAGTNHEFYFHTYNNTGGSIPLKNCEIGIVVIVKNANSGVPNDITAVCNLSWGCTKKDVIGVFGTNFSDETIFVKEMVYAEGGVSAGSPIVPIGRFFVFYSNTGSDEISSIEIRLVPWY